MSSSVDRMVKPEAHPYVVAFAAPRGEPQWLADSRRRALARFAEAGFPTRRSEAWRYLDLRALAEAPKLPQPGAPTVTALRAQLDALAIAAPGPVVVLANGRFDPTLSRLPAGDPPPGLWLGAMARAIAERPELVRGDGDEGSPLAALNGAFFSDGFVLAIAAGAQIEQPVTIVHLGGGDGSLHTRNLVVLAPDSRVALIEIHAGADSYWRNDVTELRLGDGAVLDRAVLVEEADAAMHTGETAAILAARAEFRDFVLLLGGGTVRRATDVRVTGAAARVRLDGAYLIDGRQQANIVTTVDHAAPGGETRELVKGVAGGRAHGAFQGRIIVRPDAQQVDAQQDSRNLILSERAAIDTKPELEIHADDVKCAHGATVGDLDEAALFYLLTRGIPRETARHILIEAFLRDAVERVTVPMARDYLLGRLARRLGTVEASR